MIYYTQGKHTNHYSTDVVWPDQGLNPWSTTLKASTLTITALMWFDPTKAWTHDLPTQGKYTNHYSTDVVWPDQGLKVH